MSRDSTGIYLTCLGLLKLWPVIIRLHQILLKLLSPLCLNSRSKSGTSQIRCGNVTHTQRIGNYLLLTSSEKVGWVKSATWCREEAEATLELRRFLGVERWAWGLASCWAKSPHPCSQNGLSTGMQRLSDNIWDAPTSLFLLLTSISASDIQHPHFIESIRQLFKAACWPPVVLHLLISSSQRNYSFLTLF